MDANDVIELRVHGVSGTSPSSLLDRPLVEQVAGNAIAGFYRPRLPSERRDRAPNVFAAQRHPAAELEGYNWGGLTSGSPGRALWLVLLPFTLANVAPRARPRDPTASEGMSLSGRVIWYLSRILALLLTVLLVLSTAGVGLDLIGWQCGGGDRCSKASPHWIFTKLFGTWDANGVRHHGLSTEHRLALGALIPLLVLVVLWQLSQRTINQYEMVHATITRLPDPADSSDHAASGSAPVQDGLSSVDMWNNEFQVRRLRQVHLQVGAIAVLWLVAGAFERPWQLSGDDPTGWGNAGRILWLELHTHWIGLFCLAVLAYGLVVLAVPSYVSKADLKGWRLANYGMWALIGAVGVTTALLLEFAPSWLNARYFTAGASGSARVPAGGLPGYAATFLAIFLFESVLLLVLLGVVSWASHHATGYGPIGDHRELRPGFRGMGTSVLGVAGAFLGSVFSAGTYLFASAWLHTGSLKPGFGQVSATYKVFALPEVVRCATLAYSYAVAGLVVAVVVLGGLVWRTAGIWPWRRVRLVPPDAVARDYGAAAGEDAARRTSIERDMMFGRLVDYAPPVVGTLVLVGSLISVAFGVLLFGEHVLGWSVANHIADRINPAHSSVVGQATPGFLSVISLQGTGAYLAILTLVGLVVLGSLAFRAAATRRSVGILWDVASFWPRAAHPLAAPCYAERTVPDLVTRISAHIPEHPVVLTTHSQGVVIGAAALFQLGANDPAPSSAASRDTMLARVSYMTFGNVMRRLYGRYFPVYFGPPELHRLQGLLTKPGAGSPRWRNLWRYTDYLGGQATAGPDPYVVPTGSDPRPDSDKPCPPGVVPDRPPIVGPTGWEWHSPDPPRFTRPDGATTFLPPGRHSDFWMDGSGYFQLAVETLATQMIGEIN